MGADLYITKITDAADKQYRPAFDRACQERDEYLKLCNMAKSEKMQKVIDETYRKMLPDDGYFRDSYNDSSVLWQFGLSWWKDAIPMLNKRGNLDPKALKKLLLDHWSIFENAMSEMQSKIGSPKLGHDNKPITSYHKMDEETGEYVLVEEPMLYTDEDVSYYREKANRLLRFCDTAIKLRTKISASL